MSSVASPDTARDADLVHARVGRALSRAYGQFALLLDAEFRIEWASETVGKIFGWTDVIGRNAVDLVHPDDLGLVVGAMAHHHHHAHDYLFYDRTWRPDLSTIGVRCEDGSFVLCDVAVFNHLGDPEVGALLVTGRISDDRSDLALAIDLMGCGAELDEVLPVIARLVDRTIDGVRSQVVWWNDGEEIWLSAPDAPCPPTPPSRHVTAACEARELRTHVDLAAAGIDGVAPDGERYGSVWIAPVVAPGRDDVVGCIVVWSRLPLDLVTGPQQPIHQAVRLASLAIVDHHAKSALRWAANHDSLTSLANRGGFHSQVAATDERSALMYVDLDDFKVINDRLGHMAGDAVLVEVARRIGSVVRDGDVVGRLGGDEFAVLCRGLTDATAAAEIGERVVAAVCRPIDVDGRSVTVGASVGVAVAAEVHDAGELLARADHALYRAKSLGKRRVAVDA